MPLLAGLQPKRAVHRGSTRGGGLFLARWSRESTVKPSEAIVRSRGAGPRTRVRGVEPDVTGRALEDAEGEKRIAV